MVSPKELAGQIEEAIDHSNQLEDNYAKIRERHPDPIHPLLAALREASDPNSEERMTQIEALLRYPEAVSAVQHLRSESRDFLKGFIDDETEFAHILEAIEKISNE